MDGNAPRRGGSAGRSVAIAVAILVLAGLVAVASTGSVPGGTGDTARRPADAFLDTALSLFLVLMAVCAVLVVVSLTMFRRYDPTSGAPKRRSPIQSLVSFGLSLALLALVIYAITGSRGERTTPLLPSLDDAARRRAQDGGAAYDPEFAVWPVVAVVTLLAVAGTAVWLSARARRKALRPLVSTPAEALADVLAETLDDLRAERDPRRAVIGAYARMERALAASGLPRGRAEAPEEYLSRVLDAIQLSPHAVRRLTELFAWARFSVHDVRPEMKDEAIETLEHVQAELAAAEAAREAHLAGAPA